jgi:1-aminocyclopropane-1-carboxylate deaminase
MRVFFAGGEDYAAAERSPIVADIGRTEPDLLIIPQGGFNADGIRGCMEILPAGCDYDYIAVACGTGATFAGMLAGYRGAGRFVGISPMKGPNVLPREVRNMLTSLGCKVHVAGDEALAGPVIDQHCVISAYAGRGFARFDNALEEFRREFQENSGITLDHVYTPKLFFALYRLFDSGQIPRGSRVLALHTGGLQGNEAFERRHGHRMSGGSPGSGFVATAQTA